MFKVNGHSSIFACFFQCFNRANTKPFVFDNAALDNRLSITIVYNFR